MHIMVGKVIQLGSSLEAGKDGLGNCLAMSPVDSASALMRYVGDVGDRAAPLEVTVDKVA